MHRTGERLIGPIRRECLNRMVVLGEIHLRRTLTAYLSYYHEARPHVALGRNAPVPRPVARRSRGAVVTIPQVGGPHHCYAGAA